MAAPFTTFPIPTTFAVSEWGLAVNVKDFGAVGDNTADDTTAIQAAIDYALANNVHEVFIPSGNYKTTIPLYLDPPNGLRSPGAGFPPANSSPPAFQFSITLNGSNGLPNTEQDGTSLRPTFNNGVALYVGAGQGVKVSNLNVWGPGGLHHGQQNSAGVGVGLTGTGGGSSRSVIENVGVFNFYTGFKTSANGNGTLGDSNTFIKCFSANTYYGFYIAGQQNFINSFYDCNPNDCTVGLFAPFGQGCHVFGGNWSANGNTGGYYSISSTSALASSPAGNNFTYSFTTTVAGADPALTDGIWNAFAIKTAHFGIIPLNVSYNVGTHVATCSIKEHWGYFYFIQTDATLNSDLSAEIQAATILWAAERVTTWWGNGISVQGNHIENAYAPTTLIHMGEGFGSNNPSSIRDVYFNVDPSLAPLSGSANPSPQLAQYYIAQSWPFIWMEGGAGTLTIEDCQLGVAQNDSVVVLLEGAAELRMNQISRIAHCNIFAVANVNSYFVQPNFLAKSAPGYGAGIYDIPVTLSSHNKLGNADWGRTDLQRTEFWGWRPAPWARPTLYTIQLGTLCSPGLSPISSSGGNWNINYPLMWGGQVHSVIDWAGAITPLEVVSNHHFYTYGQTLNTANVPGLAWSYKGQSSMVYANANLLELVFPGLAIKLNDGVSDVLYVVSGVYYGLGYFTVINATTSGGGQLSGNKTTVFTGTTVLSEPFAISVVSGSIAPATKTANFAVAPLDRSLIVNQGSTCTVTLPAAATYPGRSLTFKTIQAQTVVSASSNVVPLAGGSAGTAILAAIAGKWAELQSDGTNWIIVQSN